MAVEFNFDKTDDYVQDTQRVNYLKLSDDGWFATVRFMYGEGQTFKGYAVHNISADPKKPKYVPCLREPGQPLDTCPLCNNNNPLVAQYYIPLYVISITSNINGIKETKPVNQVMLFQRGKTFKGVLESIIRQCAGTPLVNNTFNIVRSGKPNDPKTNYFVEFLGRDNVGLQDLPEAPVALGTVLQEMTKEQMLQHLHGTTTQPQGVMPRTISTNTFGNNTVVGYNQGNQISPNVPF